MIRSMFAALAAAAAVLCATVPAHAEAKSVDLAQFTCAHFVEASSSGSKDDDTGLSGILFWMAGYHASDSNGTIVDFVQLQGEFEDVVKHCADHPGDTLAHVTGEHLGVGEPGSGAVDLATITCEKVNATAADKAEGLAHILMWLAGYQAGYASDTIFDAGAFSMQVVQIAEYCAANPQIGLYTASEKFMATPAE